MRAALGCALLLGCSAQATEIILVVETDVDAADTLEVEASFPGGGGPQVSTADLSELPGPRRLVLLHDEGPLGPVELAFAALDGGAPLVETRRTVTFEEGESLVLRVVLSSRCRDCGRGRVCANEGLRCREAAVEPCEYEGRACDVDAGSESDAGDDDAGDSADAGEDGGEADGGVDYPGCPFAPCETTQYCPSDCACSTECLTVCTESSCGANCESGGLCAFDARDTMMATINCRGTYCTVWAQNAGNVTVTVDAGNATVDCSGASQCRVNCNSGSCAVDCTGVPAGMCAMSCAGGTSINCADDVTVCNRGC